MCEAKTAWFFPDAYLPDASDGISHECISVLNLSAEVAEIALTLFFEDREPMVGYTTICQANRTNHIRLDRIVNDDGVSVPQCVPYAVELSGSVPVMCQYTRVDATKPAYSLMTTMGL